VLGRTYLKEKLLGLEVFGQPPVAEAGWFRALSANIEKDGFRAALLLRLAPVLPIPIDAHWCGPGRASDAAHAPHLLALLLPTPLVPLLPLHRYVCGVTPLKLGEFFLAYFVGALKVTFLDAYLGSMLTSAALATDDVAASTKVRDGPHNTNATPPRVPPPATASPPDVLSPDHLSRPITRASSSSRRSSS